MIQTALSAKQERALVALMGAKSFDQAAAQAGVGQRTLRRWLQQDAFEEAFQALRREAMSAITRSSTQSARTEEGYGAHRRIGRPGIQGCEIRSHLPVMAGLGELL